MLAVQRDTNNPHRFPGAVAVAALCWQLPFPNLGGWGTVLPFNLITLAIVGALALHTASAVSRRGISIAPATLPVLALAVVLLITVFWSGWSSVTLDALGVLLICALVTDRVARVDDKSATLLLTCITICGAVQASAGIVQLFGINLDAGLYKNAELDSQRVPTGVFQQVNVLCSFLAASYGAAGSLIAQEPVNQKPPSITGYWIHIAVVVMVAVLTAAGSRIGWISTACVFTIVTVWLSLSAKRTPAKKRYWIAATTLGVIVGVFIIVLNSPVTTRVHDKLNTETARWEIYRVSLSLISEQPHAGHGAGSFERSYREKAAELYQANPESISYLPANRVAHPHNELLFWWVQTGWLLPMSAILVVLIYAFYLRDRSNAYRYPALVIALPLLMHSNTELPLWQSLVHCLLLAIAAGLLARNARLIVFNTDSLVMHTVKRSTLLTAGILCIGLSAHGLFTNTVLWHYRQDPYEHSNLLTWVGHPLLLKTNYDFEFHRQLFNAGVETGNTTALAMFRSWANQARYRYPTAQLYQGLVWANYWLEDRPESSRIQQEAEYLFPFESFDFPLNDD